MRSADAIQTDLTIARGRLVAIEGSKVKTLAARSEVRALKKRLRRLGEELARA
jgi:hypothetical protein